jgi:hypothetical protein
MASEKLDVITPTDSYLKEVGGEIIIDAELQDRDPDLPPPAEAARRNMLEVRLAKLAAEINVTRTDRAPC